MSWLSSFLNPGKGYEKAQEQYDKYYNQAQGFQQPYNQNGINQYNTLQQMIDKLSHPEKLYDEWSKGYTESGAAKDLENLATEHGVNAASSLGLGGSNTALNAIQSGTSQIANLDKQKYLEDLMNKYLTGIQTSQGLYNTGASTANQLGQNAMTMGQKSGEAAFGEENSGGNLLSSLLGQGIGLFGSALGGPIGGALAKRWNLSGSA